MATTEYIQEKGASAGSVTPSPVLSAGESRGLVSASMLTPLPMIFYDVVAILAALGAALLLRSFFLDNSIRFIDMWHSIGRAPMALLYLTWFVLVYVMAARRYGLYGPTLKVASGAHELRMAAQACLNAGLLLCGLLYIFHNRDVSRALVLLLTLSAMVLLCIRRAAWRRRRYRLYARGLSTRHVVILGTDPISRALGRHIRSETRLGYTLRGHIAGPWSGPCSQLAEDEVLGSLEDLGSIARKYFIDEIILAEQCPVKTVVGIIKEARELGIDVRCISGYCNELSPNVGIEYLGSFPLVALHRNVPRTIAVAFKRMGDMVLSLLALIAASPTMLAITLAILVESRGPVFYISRRVGKRGRVFPCFKFRTMVTDADRLRKDLDGLNERDGLLFKMKDDPRVTRLGRFLRKYSLDELPQFFNVLRGEMSLVGPRPPLASEVEKYKLEHLRRLEVPPGLTGLWQVQARQDASFEKYIALDTAYVENWSFWLDMKILLRTAGAVLRGTGN